MKLYGFNFVLFFSFSLFFAFIPIKPNLSKFSKNIASYESGKNYKRLLLDSQKNLSKSLKTNTFIKDNHLYSQLNTPTRLEPQDILNVFISVRENTQNLNYDYDNNGFVEINDITRAYLLWKEDTHMLMININCTSSTSIHAEIKPFNMKNGEFSNISSFTYLTVLLRTSSISLRSVHLGNLSSTLDNKKIVPKQVGDRFEFGFTTNEEIDTTIEFDFEYFIKDDTGFETLRFHNEHHRITTYNHTCMYTPSLPPVPPSLPSSTNQTLMIFKGIKTSFGLTVNASKRELSQLAHNTIVQRDADIVRINGNQVQTIKGSPFYVFEPYEGYFILSPYTHTITFTGSELDKRTEKIIVSANTKTFSIGRSDEMSITNYLNKNSHNGVRIEYDNTFLHLYRQNNNSFLSNVHHTSFKEGKAYMVTSTSGENSVISFE